MGHGTYVARKKFCMDTEKNKKTWFKFLHLIVEALHFVAEKKLGPIMKT